MNQPWVVFIESNTTGTGRLFTATARRKGYCPIVLTDNPSRYPYLVQDDISSIVVATQDLATLQDTITRLAVKAPVAGIFSTSEYYIEIAASLARACDLPGANPESVAHCKNKWIQRQHLERLSLYIPSYRRATSSEEACEVAEELEWPVIVKPTLGTGSIGVRLCSTKHEVREHTSLLLGRTVNERGMPIPEEVLVEEYLKGPEFSVETLNTQILGITRKYTSSEPYFVEIGHDFPAELTTEITVAIGDAVTRALDGMDLTWGPAHTELRLTEKGPAIIEINPRLAGGFIPEIVRFATGIDLIEETVAAVVGGSTCLERHHSLFSSIRFLLCPSAGVIRAFEGIEDAATVKDVADVQIYCSVGDHCYPRQDFRDRIGHVIARAESYSDAVEAAERALSKITINMTPSAVVSRQ